MEWWNGTTSGYIGGAIGVYGAIFGICCGVFAPRIHRGEGKAFITGLMALTVVIGLVGLVVAVIALANSQPHHVWYPPTLGGCMYTFLGLMIGWTMRGRYAAAEQRKMDAEQLRRG